MGAVGRQARANLSSGRVQTALVAVTVLGASALLTVALATFGSASGAFERLHERVDGAHLWLYLDPDVVDVDTDVLPLADLPGVRAMTEPRPSITSRIRVGDEQQWLDIRDWPGEDVAVARTVVVEGRAPSGGEDDTLVLDRNLAERYDVAVGDRIDLLVPDGWSTVEVVALTVNADNCPAHVCDPAISHTAPGGLEQTGLRPAAQPDVEQLALGLRLSDPTAHEAALRTVEAALPPGAITSAWNHEFIAEMSDYLWHLQSVFLAAFGVVAAIAAGFIIANAIGDAVRSQTRQIGLLKAVGFTRRQLAGTYLGQYLGLALIASLVGVAVGIGLAAWSLAAVTARFGETSGGLPWWVVAVVPVTVVTIAVVFTLLPVRRATRVDVVTAMRTGSTGARGRATRLARLPATAATAMADLRARPARTLLTAAGLGLAAVTVTFASVVVTTLDALADDPEHGLVPAADLTVERPETLGDAEVRAVFAATGEVQAVRSERWVPWSYPDDATRHSAFAQGGDLSAFPVPLIEGDGVQRSGDAMVSYKLAVDHDLEPGSTFPVVIAGHDLDLHVTGVYREPANLGQAFTLHADTLTEVDPDAQPGGYQLLLTDDADVDAVATELVAASDGLLDPSAARSFAAPVLDTLPAIMLALVLILAAIALLGVFNTVWMGVQERTRELGLLKAVGMDARQVVGSVLTGAAGMAVLGFLVGLPAGLVLTRLLLEWLGRSIGFGPIASTADPVLLVLALPVLVLLATVGALIPARRAARLSVADALRAE